MSLAPSLDGFIALSLDGFIAPSLDGFIALSLDGFIALSLDGFIAEERASRRPVAQQARGGAGGPAEHRRAEALPARRIVVTLVPVSLGTGIRSFAGLADLPGEHASTRLASWTRWRGRRCGQTV